MYLRQEQLKAEIIPNGIIFPPPVDEGGRILFCVNTERLCGVCDDNLEYIDISARSCMTQKEPSSHWEERKKERKKEMMI